MLRKSLDDQRLLLKVARLYYEEDMTQHEIAQMIGVSRAAAQRLLKRARLEGIVRIGICPIMGVYSDLERQLEERFGLRETVVIETSDYADHDVNANEIGAGAADYLMRVLKLHDRIVISWGSALLGLVNSLFYHPRKVLDDIQVIQGLGGLVDPNHEVHAAELTRRLARELGGQAVLLPAPGAVGSRQTCEVIYSDPHVKKSLDIARSANLALVSIGAPRKESILIQSGNIVDWEELSALKGQGAVGDINLRYFDLAGRPVDSDLNGRVIGLTLGELKSIGHVIGVAGGEAKLHAILGALHGRLIDVLVTDHVTAEKLLKLEDEKHIGVTVQSEAKSEE